MQTPDPGQDTPLLHTVGRRAVRRKRVLISCDLLRQLITQGSDSADFPWGARCTQGLPPDARLVHSSVEWQGSSPILTMFYEHPQWPEVPEGQLIPELVVRFEQYRRTPDERPAVQPAEGAKGAKGAQSLASDSSS